MNAGCAGKTEIPWERVPYLSALEVCSRQGAIQIHVYLTLKHLMMTDLSQYLDISPTSSPFWHGCYNMAKFDPNLDFEVMKQYIWNLKRTRAALMTVLCPPEIWLRRSPISKKMRLIFVSLGNLGKKMCWITQLAQRPRTRSIWHSTRTLNTIIRYTPI